MILNNNGGFSHGGLRIELMQDGDALVSRYSDAIGDSKSERATYELDQNTLLIRYPRGGVTKLQKITYKGKIYWVDPINISRLTENSNRGEWARKVALRPVKQ